MNAFSSRGALSIRDAVKYYGEQPSRLLAVDHCSLDIYPGEICMILGPSGCGKTTLLNVIAGFHRLDEGSITLDGRMLVGPGKSQAAAGSDRMVVFQNGALFPWMTNLDNVAYGPVAQRKLSRADARAKAARLLREAGLAGHEYAYPGETSSGVRRRVEIVRALMNDPTVLLLDEPYRALDALTKSVMHESLLEMHYRTGITIFFITHDLEEAIFLGHRVVVMTARPGRPKKIIEVDIPHPRDYTVLASRRFRELLAEANEAVREEALKSFSAGEADR